MSELKAGPFGDDRVSIKPHLHNHSPHTHRRGADQLQLTPPLRLKVRRTDGRTRKSHAVLPHWEHRWESAISP